ncbi:MAG: C4-dicarboxylate transporter DctA [Saprospiraceae bacterium]
MRFASLLRTLYVQVLIAIAAGALTGLLAPSFAASLKPVADTFINMIKMVIGPVIFLTIVLGVGSVGDMKQLGRIGGKALLYFEVVTTFALFIGLFVAHWTRPGGGIDTSGAQADKVSGYVEKATNMNWVDFFTHIVPSNVVRAFAEGEVLQILFFALLFGIGLNSLQDTGAHLRGTFDRLLKALFKVLHLVMRLAPVGAFGGIAYTVGKFGPEVLMSLGRLLLAVYITMGLFIFVVLGLICRWWGFSLTGLLRHLREEILLVLGTSSSEAVLPQLMHKLETYGCRREVVGLVVPTGYSFNLDGTTIYLSMAVIFLAQAYGVDLSVGEQLSIMGVLMLTSKGAAAVTGGGFVVLASTLAIVPSVPVEGLALLLGVDRFMSEARAVTNFVGNAVATVVISKSENKRETGRGGRVA